MTPDLEHQEQRLRDHAGVARGDAASGWDTDDPQPVGEVTVAQLRAIAESEGFAAGSMRPKVQAVVRFVERTGGRAVITELGRICDALDGAVGTRVVPVG